MPHLYPELFLFVLVSCVPLVMVWRANTSNPLAGNRLYIFMGCLLLSATASIDYAEHFWTWYVVEQSVWHTAVVVFGILPGGLILGYGVAQWLHRTSELKDEVTRRKAAEAKLILMTKELEATANEAARANQAKTDFLANMSHELRTPLNAIIGFTELMNAELFGKVGAPEYKEYLNIVHDSGQQLLDVISDLLDLSKIEAGQMVLREEHIQLGDLAEQCVALLYAETAKKAVHIDVLHTVPMAIKADVRMVRQIMLNLLTNAIRVSHEGGNVALLLRASRNGGAVIEVKDTGYGMTRADIERITQPFGYGESIIARSHEGATLGLSLVNTFVELHGGILMIEPQQGIGTAVMVKFPPNRRVSARRITERRISVA